jgi:hypothetical protein
LLIFAGMLVLIVKRAIESRKIMREYNATRVNMGETPISTSSPWQRLAFWRSFGRKGPPNQLETAGEGDKDDEALLPMGAMRENKVEGSKG